MENETIKAEVISDEPKKRFHAFKYWADVVKWFINLIGVVVDSLKDNQFPKKDDYTN
jgi:hypothetical protein